MRRRGASVAVAAFAALHVVVLAGPAVVLAVTAEKGGLPRAHGIDLVVASGVIGTACAAVVSARLRRELRRGVAARNEWIASVDASVVLALASSLLVIGMLGGFTPLAAILVNRGWPVVILWSLVQLVAVVLAEASRRRLLRWLEAGPSPRDGVAPDRAANR